MQEGAFRGLWVLAVMVLGGGFVWADYGGGLGTAEEPYEIWSAGDLVDLSLTPDDWGKRFLLMADLDLGGVEGGFQSIGTEAVPFTGVFDGGGCLIANFVPNEVDEDFIGLFGLVSDPNALITDVGMFNPVVEIDPYSKLNAVGSLVGELYEGTVSRCHSVGGSISDRECPTGGLVGINSGLIIDSFASTPLEVRSVVCEVVCYAGGLVGINEGEIVNCYSTGSVANISLVKLAGSCLRGGFVGMNGGVIINSFWDAEASGNERGEYHKGAVEGLIGLATAEMQSKAVFVDAGWDFDDVWGISDTLSYPYVQNRFPTVAGFEQQHSDYMSYLEHGFTREQMTCWHEYPYQCDGDTDNSKGWCGWYRTYIDDLNTVVGSWKKTIDDPTLDPCGDLDHAAETFFEYRVFINDLNIAIVNWKRGDSDLPGNCPRPDDSRLPW